MNILCDSHHEELFETLHTLFHKRMGANLYRPIGLDWYSGGYWHLHATPSPHPDTVNQYLRVYSPPDTELSPGIWKIPRCTFWPTSYHQGIELAVAKETKWDLMIASIPEHFYAYSRFAREYCPTAKVVFQQGNMWNIPSGVTHVLNSTTMPLPKGVQGVSYHPEFHYEWLEPDRTPEPRTVCTIQAFHPQPSKAVFFEVEKLLADWQFFEYGAANKHASISDPKQEALIISMNSIIWHWKPCGEGYGFVLHRAFAAGRPVFCNYAGLKHCSVGLVLEEGVNCVELMGKSPQQISEDLVRVQAEYPKWSQAMRQKFLEVVDWEKEYLEIKAFVEKILS